MYKELGSFLKHILKQKSIWKDGELWTGVVSWIVAVLCFREKPEVMMQIKIHFSEILTLTSIIFGFVLATLTFYISVSSTWRRDEKINAIAEKLVDWHVWSILCLLFFIGYTIIIWGLDAHISKYGLKPYLYAFLVFVGTYIAGQIINHTLTLWWVFHNRDALKN